MKPDFLENILESPFLPPLHTHTHTPLACAKALRYLPLHMCECERLCVCVCVCVFWKFAVLRSYWYMLNQNCKKSNLFTQAAAMPLEASRDT